MSPIAKTCGGVALFVLGSVILGTHLGGAASAERKVDLQNRTTGANVKEVAQFHS